MYSNSYSQPSQLGEDLRIVSRVTWEFLRGDFQELPPVGLAPAESQALLRLSVRERVATLASLAGLRPWVQPGFFDVEAPGAASQEDESEPWYFVNGILTDRALLEVNGQELARLFGRKIHLLHNPTQGVSLDLLESVAGRTFDLTSRPAEILCRELHSILQKSTVRRVVVLAHSQGAIIMSNVIASLIKECAPDDCWVDKLEVYTFGGAADEMQACPHRSREHARPFPYVEHFANEADPIARIGVLEARTQGRDRRIMGDIFVRPAKGHLLNSHYLPHLEHYRCDRQEPHAPRLMGYLEGRTPAPLQRLVD